jgi:hypothetical protein
MPGEPPKIRKISNKLWLRQYNVLAQTFYFRQYYLRWRRRSTLQNSQRFAYSSRHHLFFKLHCSMRKRKKELYRETTRSKFQIQINLDHHSPRRKLYYCLLPATPLTFRYYLPLTAINTLFTL